AHLPSALPSARPSARPSLAGERSSGVRSTGSGALCSNRVVDPMITPLHQVLERVDGRLLSPESDVRIWSTGFPLLDDTLGGGLRAGALNLLAGSQGEGKTTFALQVARHSAREGRPILFFSYELEAEVLLQKVLASEAAESGVETPIS